ncbi:hypothetical protein [Rheinheimera sp. NSM]|uniref:hypothetical protein n=1 Tax=Rheinheimera sp. NSM TaxID=3457884 RepID=UPI00403626C3
MSDNKNHELTDIRPVLLDIERIIDQSPKQYKPSMLLLHGLFNYIITPEQKTKGCVEFCEKYEGILIGDTPEQLIGLTIIGKTNIWSIDDHRALHDKYFNQRSKKSGFHAPQYFEAAASLELAERYRLNGDVTNAQELIATAVENFPSCKSLHQLETDFNDGYVIKWHTVLFPKNVDKPTDQVQ